MSNAAALVAALHTAGGHKGRYVSEWLALAQTDSGLGDAFRQVFGKRLPTPQKLGLWITEHVGAHGGLILETKYSGRRKAWAARVTTPEHAAAQRVERERAAAERDAQSAAAAAERQGERLARLPTCPSPTVQTAPTPERYEYELDIKIDNTGHITRKVAIGRDGQPVKIPPAAPEAPAAEPTPPTVEVDPQRENDPRPPWLQRGDSGPRDKAEWLAWQRSRTQPGQLAESHAVTGFADPCGVVGRNIATEQNSERGFCRVVGRWPGR